MAHCRTILVISSSKKCAWFYTILHQYKQNTVEVNLSVYILKQTSVSSYDEIDEKESFYYIYIYT